MAVNPSYLWLAARARNALRRKALVSIATGLAFVTALIGLVLIPRQATRVAHNITTAIQPRADTLAVLAMRRRAESLIRTADSALASARRVNAAAAAAPQAPVDTTPPELRAERDSLQRLLSALTSAMGRASESPLPPAFRALGETPALRSEPRVRVWLDSLDQVDRLRAPFGALGAGDPIYIALTARVNELGRSIRDAAAEKRSELRARIAPLLPPPPPPTASVHIDTLPIALELANGRRELASAIHQLDSTRALNAHIDSVSSRARDLANVGAPPIAMLGAALVIALAAGFGIAFAGEVRHPRIAHVREGEAVSGVRVLAVVQPTNVVERARRQSDVQAPPLIDIISESYRRLYLHLAATGASVPVVTVTGDIQPIVATVASNLAAVAAYEARSTLLVDADPTSNTVAPVLRIQSAPGLSEVLGGRSELLGSMVTTTIGRDRPLDVLPSGNERQNRAQLEMVRSVREALARMERRYDFIVIAAPTSYVELASDTIIPAPDVVLCARVGYTRVADLRRELKSLRNVGRTVHGLVLWDEEMPRLG